MESTQSEDTFVYDVDFYTGQPYPIWKDAREHCPVIRTKGTNTFSGRPTYHVTKWDDVEAVLRDGETFSSSINAEHIGQYMGELMLAMDGKEHRAYRNLVAHAFRASQLEQWDAALVRPTINALLDVIAPAGHADLVADVTSRYPVQVICGIVGVPLEDTMQFHEWAEQINTGPIHPEVGMVASRAMRAYLEPIVEDRRANPQGDLISDLVHAEIDGHQLTDEKIYGFLRLLLPAGAETTFRAMGNALVALLEVPGLYDRVIADRSLVPAVIEETLRW
jgi:cytochrome P450